MKKLQLLVLFFAITATDIFPGKTVRNSASQPNARKQYLAQDYKEPRVKQSVSSRVQSEKTVRFAVQKTSQQATCCTVIQ